MDASALIPVHIVTGALGSGKTTLLNESLRSGLGADTAVVINDFGEVALDQLFIQSRTEDTLVLQSGCVCCTIRSDLVSTLMQLVALRPSTNPFRRILIETSGLSDPVPILQTLRADPRLAARFRIGAVVCTVSAIDGMQTRPEALRQLAAADAVVITKRDLVDPRLPGQVAAQATGLNRLAGIVARDGPALARWLEDWEKTAEHSPRWFAATEQAADEPHGVRSIMIRGAAPASWPQFAVWLTRLVFVHGDRILRTKGVLFDAGRGVWIAVHGVRRFFHPPVHLELAAPPSCDACLVFITEDLDPHAIERSYRRLVAQPENASADSRRVDRASMPATSAPGTSNTSAPPR